VVSITNGGSGILGGLAIGTINYMAGPNWLTASLDSSTAPATLTLNASAASLPAGSFTALVPISSTAEDVVNSPRMLPFTLMVQPRPSGLVLSPAQVTISRKFGVAVPGLASFSVTASGDTQLSHVGFGAFSQGTVGVTAGMICQGSEFALPCTGNVNINYPASLPVGTYSGSFAVKEYNGGQTATMYITVVITP
jgi:hypothetical protein